MINLMHGLASWLLSGCYVLSKPVRLYFPTRIIFRVLRIAQGHVSSISDVDCIVRRTASKLLLCRAIICQLAYIADHTYVYCARWIRNKCKHVSELYDVALLMLTCTNLTRVAYRLSHFSKVSSYFIKELNSIEPYRIAILLRKTYRKTINYNIWPVCPRNNSSNSGITVHCITATLILYSYFCSRNSPVSWSI